MEALDERTGRTSSSTPTVPSANPTPAEIDRVLRERFGLDAFRPGQREAIEALLGDPGKVLLVAPTGGGKSLTYQLPAALLPGLTLVISPLVALMEDQVRTLTARGIPATYVASSIDGYERRAREHLARDGAVKLLYCAPERLASDAFVEFLAGCAIDLVAIDEAHCIAQWGHDFRPDYLRLGDLLERLQRAAARRGKGPIRVLACTATATPRVRDEIRTRLKLEGAKELLRGFARPNLHLSARSVDGIKEARGALLDVLDDKLGAPKAPKGAAIVYCATRKVTEQIATELRRRGWNAAAYHAGMDADVRAEVNAAFANGKVDVVAATNAFGMGIDRADVRLVAHLQPPASLEAYYQEVGRAGRDGDEAHGLLLCSGADVSLRRRLCEGDSRGGGAVPAELAARNWALFRELLRYLDAGSCRHDFILRYFGDEREVLGGCGHCDVCAELDAGGETGGDDVEAQDAAVDVRKGLAGVARAKQRGGLVAIAEMLRGESSERVERFGFDGLSTFGVLRDKPQPWVLSLLRALLAAGWIDLTPTEHPVPFVTPAGWRVMTGTGPVRLRIPDPARKPKKRGDAPRRSKDRDATPLDAADAALFEALRAHRAERAKERRLPAYVVAQDATLAEIARKRPRTEDELLSIRGMGPLRIETYGEGFLEVVRQVR